MTFGASVRTSLRARLEGWAIVLLFAQAFVAIPVTLLGLAAPVPDSGRLTGGIAVAIAGGLVAAIALSHVIGLGNAARRLLARSRDLEVAAYSDVLTGLGNRRGFEAQLQEEWDRAAASGTVLSLMIVDADHFKAFNDTYGHPEGDQLLRATSAALRAVLELSGHRGFRYGGEEFAALLPATGPDRARGIAAGLMQAVASMRRAHVASELGVYTVSIGIASAHPADTDATPEMLVRAADQALYRAKRDGRNRIRVATETVDPPTRAPLPQSRADRLIDGCEIVLENGRVVRIGQTIDVGTLANIVSLVGAAD